jgi:hypothetical protein
MIYMVLEDNHEANAVVAEIDAAFSSAPWPPPHRIIQNRRDIESQEIASILKANHWRDLPFDTVFQLRDSLPFLSPEAFRFYLPAYMITAIRHYEDADTLPEYVVYQLASPADNTTEKHWFLQNAIGLTIEQRRAVVSFLEYMEKKHGADFPNGEPQRALRYWTKFAGRANGADPNSE